ncbi:hypothetical protein BVH01_01455 [Pseudomonas sp. PA1(2017)]|uniref:hypothetical protein n=1 Tax=Pseudomonas sp. PA1(2017) TaxID=1932113 RepID=UPI0009627BC9|nr:hypothetical protein [Pseudomonas sp. PA1(2017)]OLU20635.1 hypothetical protein BVH01_01455 [Pseudomonas sp. PA1(2017)]
MHCHQLTLFADYHQFYLQDETASGDLSQAWSSEAVERMLAVADGVVGFGTLRNMQVGVTLEMLEEPPASDTAGFDHVVEGSLDARSGTLVVAGCTDYFPDAARFALAPGIYRVRLSISGADTLSEDGLDGEDHYLVQLWQAPLAEPAVLKQG